MRHIAITGGIGSGKSFVCRALLKHGIEVYDCDDAAKRLYYTDTVMQSQLKRLVGENVYEGNKLQKRILAQFILASEENKQAINDIVHPAVAKDYMQSGLQWLESAILFDSGFYKRVKFDYIVCVSAPLEVRVERIMRRDGLSREKALEWINRQWPQEKTEQLSDFIITNDGIQDIDSQVSQLLETV